MIYKNIEELLAYSLSAKLIEPGDVIWARNSLLALLALPSAGPRRAAKKPATPSHPGAVLADMSFYAAENGLLPSDTITYREIFETALMAVFTERPSNVSKKFFALMRGKNGAKKATDWFYKYCRQIYYIKDDRTAKNIAWKTQSAYGQLELVINLAKPERDPREIALHAKMAASGPNSAYPACLLCKENEGYQGRLNHPARQNLRLIPLKLNGGDWHLQYSPYVYYNEHSIVFSGKHIPMKITGDTFKVLLDFVQKFPHYFIGSNADFPIVGGSILAHEHYQAGRHVFALEKAGSVKSLKVAKFPKVSFDIVRWPLSVLRVRGPKADVAAACERVLKVWQKYSDEAVNIRHATGKRPHNTLTPIARYKNGKYEVDLVLRNNRATPAAPRGLFHTSAKYHNIKRENIGIIEVLGMAVLPGRLKTEMAQTAALLARGEAEKMRELSSLAQHYDWVQSFIKDYKTLTPATAPAILMEEIGQTFAKALYDCAVFKHDAEGKAAFLRFIKKI